MTDKAKNLTTASLITVSYRIQKLEVKSVQ